MVRRMEWNLHWVVVRSLLATLGGHCCFRTRNIIKLLLKRKRN